MTAKKKLAEIRDGDRLGHLRRRPRCSDGGLDMRSKANRGLSKHAVVTDFYDPAKPNEVIEKAVIQQLLDRQQDEYDALRFQELSERVNKLE